MLKHEKRSSVLLEFDKIEDCIDDERENKRALDVSKQVELWVRAWMLKDANSANYSYFERDWDTTPRRTSWE